MFEHESGRQFRSICIGKTSVILYQKWMILHQKNAISMGIFTFKIPLNTVRVAWHPTMETPSLPRPLPSPGTARQAACSSLYCHTPPDEPACSDPSDQHESGHEPLPLPSWAPPTGHMTTSWPQKQSGTITVGVACLRVDVPGQKEGGLHCVLKTQHSRLVFPECSSDCWPDLSCLVRRSHGECGAQVGNIVHLCLSHQLEHNQPRLQEEFLHWEQRDYPALLIETISPTHKLKWGCDYSCCALNR